MHIFLMTIMLTIILILILTIYSLINKLKNITQIIDEIIKYDNLNRKVIINNNNKYIKNLVISINSILDKIRKIENEKIRKTNMMKRMISNISHDFKTPLTSLMGYAELVKTSKMLDADTEKYLNIIYDKAHFLNKIIEDFYYLSLLESEDIIFNIKSINLSEIVENQIVLFYDDFERNDIIPKIEFPKEDIYVVADQKSVERIFNNIISNSLKYGVDGNEMGIIINTDYKYAYVDIWDNGKGIPEKELHNIFERLYTVEHSRNINISGIGIGLSIVKELLTINKGKIYVTSEPFSKTSFKFYLPKSI